MIVVAVVVGDIQLYGWMAASALYAALLCATPFCADVLKFCQSELLLPAKFKNQVDMPIPVRANTNICIHMYMYDELTYIHMQIHFATRLFMYLYVCKTRCAMLCYDCFPFPGPSYCFSTLVGNLFAYRSHMRSPKRHQLNGLKRLWTGLNQNF